MNLISLYVNPKVNFKHTLQKQKQKQKQSQNNKTLYLFWVCVFCLYVYLCITFVPDVWG